MKKISVLLLAFGAALAGGTPARAEPVLPDLVADTPVAVKIENTVDPSGNRLLLRFTAYIHNAGPGVVEIDGTDGANLVMGQVAQRVFDADGNSTLLAAPLAELRYETNDTHKHWHLMKIAAYRLMTAERTSEVAPSQKVGFCLGDAEEVVAGAPQLYPDTGACAWNRPDAGDVSMGISPGWRDVYGWSLAFQYIDVSNVQPGKYELRANVDPNNVVTEADEINLPSYAVEPVGIPGYVARAQTVKPHSRRPVKITLAAKTVTSYYRDLGPREFKIVHGPRHGKLSVPTGRWFSAAAVRYTPGRGGKSDGFSFVARDRNSPRFPASPAAASVVIGRSPRARAAVSGAPARMTVGTTVRLHAPRFATFSVPAASDGRVSRRGVFRAPRHVPRDGTATVLVRTPGGTTTAARIAIVEAPRPVSTPTVALAASGPESLVRVAAAHRGPVVAAGVRAQRSGHIALELLADGRRARSCTFTARRGLTYNCRLRVPEGAHHLALSAVLSSSGHADVRRRVLVAHDDHR